MNSTVFRISLDIHEVNSQVTLRVKLGDSARQILIALTEGGRPYKISEDCMAVFTAKKPDETILYNGCEIQGNRILYAMTPQTCTVVGAMKCEIRVYGAGGALITSPRFTIEAISGGYDEGYADGAASVPKFNEWGELRLYSLNVFNQKEVVLNLPRVTSLHSFLNIMEDGDINTTVEHLTINCPNIVDSISYAFNGAQRRKDTKLKKLTLNVDTSKATNSYLAFYIFAAIEEIDGTPLDLSGITANSGERMFELAKKLREVRFKGSIPCNLKFPVSPLSKDSILSVFSCLSADVSGKTLTINKEAVDKAFETSPGAADGSTSAEWLALVAAHSNWTISLV